MQLASKWLCSFLLPQVYWWCKQREQSCSQPLVKQGWLLPEIHRAFSAISISITYQCVHGDCTGVVISVPMVTALWHCYHSVCPWWQQCGIVISVPVVTALQHCFDLGLQHMMASWLCHLCFGQFLDSDCRVEMKIHTVWEGADSLYYVYARLTVWW